MFGRSRLLLAIAMPLGLAGGLWATLCSSVSAQEDGEISLMREPHSYVDVVDAFDDDDPFDINITAGFLRRWTFGNIQRERGTVDPGVDSGDPNRLSRRWVDIARHEHTQNILNLGVDVGIFRDLALYARLPIILSDDRGLSRIGGRDPGPNLLPDNSANPNNPDAEPLFAVGPDGFAAPTRSGVDYISAGIAWSMFNQNRDASLPTWLLMLEGRFNIGDSLRACDASASSARCRQWTQADGGDWSFADTDSGAGSSRGTNALRLETRASWRTRYVEPYIGLMFQIEWPGSSERFFLPANNISGFINERPPIRGQLTGGVAIVPWENRAAWQQFTVDVRFSGTYVSEGHGYSPLFDALGTSMSPYLSEPNLEGVPPRGDLRLVPFFGLTDMEAHAELGATLRFEMRAARYIRFGLGATLFYISPYVITFADACNPGVSDIPDGDARRGSCRSGIINPHHRPVIDLPGQRFRVDEQIRLDLFANVVAMF